MPPCRYAPGGGLAERSYTFVSAPPGVLRLKGDAGTVGGVIPAHEGARARSLNEEAQNELVDMADSEKRG